MKKTLLLIVALLMMGSAAFAGGGFGFAIGPKVGYQTAKMNFNDKGIKEGFSNHFTAGIFARVNFGRIYVQPEILYFKTSNVFKMTVDGTGSTNLFNLPTGAHLNLTLNEMYLQVPVLVGFNILDFKLLTLRAHVGPTANFVLNSKTLFDKTYSIDNQQYEVQNATTDEKFDTKSISWGLQAGIGVDIIDRITLDINYNFGLSKVFQNLNNTVLGETFDFSNVNTSKQSMFMVTVGVKLIKL